MSEQRADVPPGHRSFRPDPGPSLVWPEAFGTRFAVFVDCEEEFDWSAPFDRAQRRSIERNRGIVR